VSSETSQSRRSITSDDLFRIQLVSDPHVSPSGDRVAWVQTRLDKEDDTYKSAIWISSLDGSGAFPLTSGIHRDTNPRWSPDGTRVAFVSSRPATIPPTEDAGEPKKSSKPAKDDKKQPNQIWTIPVDGGEARQATAQSNGASAPAWSPDGRQIAFISSDEPGEGNEDSAPTSVGPIADERVVRNVSYRFDARGFLDRFNHVWVVDVLTGEARQLTDGPALDSSPTWSPDGATIAFTGNRTAERSRHWNRSLVYTVPASGGDITPLTPEDANFGDPVFAPSGERLALVGHLGTNSTSHDNIWVVNVDGSGLTNLTSASDLNCSDAGMSDVAGSNDGSPRWQDDETICFLASARGETQVFSATVNGNTASHVTSGKHRIAGFDLAGQELVVVRGRIDRPFELERWTGNGDLVAITDANRLFLDEVALIEAIDLDVTAADGQSIQAWIIPPFTYDADSPAKHPLIIQIHGGPHSMYGYALFHEMQLMAAQGFAVTFCNPRGSSGYGEEFLSCTRGIWGEADMPDVMALVDEVSALPWIDTDRLGVTGGSYGGYLTNWIIGHDTRFKAAVTQRCVSSFLSFFGTSDIGTTFGVHEFDGLPWSDTIKLHTYSPIAYVDRIETPLLILHSEQDLRCPIEQAEQMFASLKYLEREVKFVRIPGEGHELSRSGTPSRRLARLHHLTGWFESHL
jgi:dipeptidyl aminopeptidase/acylaminoacyl peptidase